MKGDSWNRCTECGRFVSYQDILNGKATHKLVTPESLRTRETFETMCKKHAIVNVIDAAMREFARTLT